MTIKGFHSKRLLSLVQYSCWTSVFLLPFYFEPIVFFTSTVMIAALGFGAAMHRFFSHHSFETGTIRHWLLGLLATLSTQGSIAHWIEMHRLHHIHSDTEEDPISPSQIGNVRSFLCLQDERHFKKMRPRAVVKAMRDPVVKFFHNWYWPTVVFYCALLYSVGDWVYVLNGYLAPVMMVRLNLGISNLLGHGALFPKLCYRNHNTPDNSVNGVWIDLLNLYGLLSEPLHNNHHGDQTKYIYTERWYELDITGLIIKYVFAK